MGLRFGGPGWQRVEKDPFIPSGFIDKYRGNVTPIQGPLLSGDSPGLGAEERDSGVQLPASTPFTQTARTLPSDTSQTRLS